MEIWHSLTFGNKDQVDAEIAALGVKYKKGLLPGGGYLLHIDVRESDPEWPRLAEMIRRTGALDMFDTVFTPEEILNAEWSRLMPSFKQGYPQPESTMRWRDIAYQNRCPQCGTGYRQITPFHLAKEPRMGKKDFVSLFWTLSLFCTSRVLDSLDASQIRGYEVWDAILHRSKQPSTVVWQLLFPHVAAPALAEQDRLQPEPCPYCGITKYGYHKKGYMHLERTALVAGTDFQLTHEWFGSGQRAFRETLISRRIAQLIFDKGWRGVSLKPVMLI